MRPAHQARRARAVAAALLLLAAACGQRSHGRADAGAEFTATASPTAPPTADECARAVAHMRELDPEEVAGDQSDRDTCGRMPGKVVRCLLDARTRNEADVCVHDFARTAPEGRATEDECRRAVTHARHILSRAGLGIRDAGEDMLVAQCARTATMADVQCLLQARTAGEVKQCGYDDGR